MPNERASERASSRARRRPSPNVVSVAAQYLEISEWVNYGPMERPGGIATTDGQGRAKEEEVDNN